MRIHHLKTWPEPYEAIVDGRKRFEYRKDDRGFALGDLLVLNYWDPTPSGLYGPIGYGPDSKRRWTLVRVTYVLRGFEGLPAGYVVLGIEPVSESPDLLGLPRTNYEPAAR